MKAHLAKLSLALLSTVFLLGCQEWGSEPVGPDGLGPQFNPRPHDHGGGKKGDEATFRVTFVNSKGVECTEVGEDECNIVGKIDVRENSAGSLTTGSHKTWGNLNLAFFGGAVTDEGGYDARQGAACFGDPKTESSFRAGFSIIVKKNDLPNVFTFFEPFEANGFDGSSPVKYRLELPGMVTGTLPPDAGDITTIKIEKFNMRHSGGPGSSVACTGTGDLSSFFKITRTT